MKRIFLIGYMGSGKTTLGRAFSKEQKLTFIDLDWYIEERFHKTIQQIFAERGENGFRELERRMLHEVADFEDVVIAAGGGTPCFFDNMDFMNEHGVTVLLEAKPSTLFNRLKVAKSQRPLLANKSDEELMTFSVRKACVQTTASARRTPPPGTHGPGPSAVSLCPLHRAVSACYTILSVG